MSGGAFTGETPQARLERLRAAVVDYLYDSLPEDARRELESALEELPELREEVDELARTLRASRRMLRATEEPVPPAVRARVLEAAARAQARGATVRAPAAGGEGSSSPAGASNRLVTLLGWLRQPWAYGVVGAAAAVLLFVVARGQWSDRAALREAIERGARSSPEGARAPVPVSPVQQAEAAPSEELGATRYEAAAPSTGRARPAHANAQLDLKADSSVSRARPGRKPSAGVARERDLAADDGERLGARANEAPARAAAARASGADGFAQPPPGWGGGGVGSGLAPSAPVAAPAPAPAPAPRLPAAGAAEAEAESVPGSLSPKKEKPARLAGMSRDELVQRAESMLAAGRKTEALAVYRELMRRFPRDSANAAWRVRAAALQAELDTQ